MNSKRVGIALLLLSVAVLAGCGGENSGSEGKLSSLPRLVLVDCGSESAGLERELNRFSEIVQKGNLSDLRLTIYYNHPGAIRRFSWSTEYLIDHSPPVVVEGKDLGEHISLLGNVASMTLECVQVRSYVDAYVYYLFESIEDGNIFDVVMWGGNNTLFINGIEIKENEILYSIIRPFLPEEISTNIPPSWMAGG